jgi:hydrogenase maturation protein HypF
MTPSGQRLPRPAPARVLAVGAWLKNTACLLDGAAVHWSPLHGDLGTAEARRQLEASVPVLLRTAGGRVDAVAHDLHPDFASTRLALAWAERLGVPAIPVQHHHAHIGVVQAALGRTDPVIGLALDGVGLGSDGTAWGGELLQVAGAQWQRLGHLTPLAMPGGDVAAREPWRMAAAALHALGRGDEAVARFAPAVGEGLARGVHGLLQRGLNCPTTTSAGRWFDAVAGLLGLSVRQTQEAEAALALERVATEAHAAHAEALDRDDDAAKADTPLDLCPLLSRCLGDRDADGDVGRAAARFHHGLARRLATAAGAAARRARTNTMVLGGGCFHNRLLTRLLVDALEADGLDVHRPEAAPAGPGPGDAGLALGQAWVAAHALAHTRAAPQAATRGEPACA